MTQIVAPELTACLDRLEMPERMVLADDFDLGEIEETACALGWSFGGIRRPPETTNFVKFWLTDEGATVLYVDDPIIGVRYVLVNGKKTDKTRRDIKRTVRLLSRAAVIAEAEKARGFTQSARAGRRLLTAGRTYWSSAHGLMRSTRKNEASPCIAGDDFALERTQLTG